jgi:hypothetical protein
MVRRGQLIRLRAAAGFAGILLVLTACASPPAPVPAPTTAAISPSATPAPPAEPSPPQLAPGRLLATGRVSSRDGQESATVRITAGKQQETYVLTLTDIRSVRPGNIEVLLSPGAYVAGAPCFDTGRTLALSGQLAKSGSQTFDLNAEADYFGDDPSFVHAVVFTSDDGDATRCLDDAVAAGNLTWTMPDMRPWMTVVDGGARTDARGTVNNVDGAPASYLVAAGDTLSAIASRFGITIEDVFYLNPDRATGNRDAGAHEGETLNLSKDRR